MDNQTLDLFKNSLKADEAEIARLTERAGGYREAIKTEEQRRASVKARRQKVASPQADQGAGEGGVIP